MWKRPVTLVAVAALLGLLFVFSAPMQGQAPGGKEPPKKDPPTAERIVPAPAVDPAVGKIAASRVVAVTVYPNSALVTREVDVPAGKGTSNWSSARCRRPRSTARSTPKAPKASAC